MTLQTLLTQARAVRVLRRSIVGVGAAGLACATLASFGGSLMDVTASAAVSGGGHGSGSSSESVEGMTSGAPAEVAQLAASTVEAPPVVETPPITVAPAAPTAKVQPTAAVRATIVEQPSAESVQDIITSVFGANAQSAIGVARCESRLQPGAISKNGANWGLFQINKAHRSRVAAMGYQWEDLLDARVNALVAKSIFDEQGWGPWACRHAAR